MRVGTQGTEATLGNALSMSSQFALKRNEAIRELRVVASAVERWKEHFVAVGVSARDIESYEEQIDRPFLRDPRIQFLSARRKS